VVKLKNFLFKDMKEKIKNIVYNNNNNLIVIIIM